MLWLFLFFSIFDLSSAQVIVHTSRGYVSGYHVNYGNDTSKLYYGTADVFLGIPYAVPPLGEKRFEIPGEICRFPNFYTSSSPWNATFSRPACPQNYAKDDQMSEDCLYLNIITPKSNSSVKYPVMVWIHGGGYFVGSMRSGVSAYYSIKGAIRNLVSRGVVVVNMQYRIGLLGFFTTKTEDFPANRGLLDQVLALQFIKEEISNFGGDPNKITLFGNSAGGCSISAHTYSPLSQGLFHQAILQSGTIWTCFDNVIGSQTALSLSYARAKALCNYTNEKWENQDFSDLKTCLLNADFHEFLTPETWEAFLGWKITVDGELLRDYPGNLWQRRKNIPIMMGTVKDEFATWIYYSEQSLKKYGPKMLAESLKKYAPKLLKHEHHVKEILKEIFSRNIKEDDHLGWLKVLSQIFTGAFFTAFTSREADFHLANNNSQVYLYEFTHPTRLFMATNISGWSPVQHSTERYYIWMPERLWTPAIEKGLANAMDVKIADRFGETWTNFAKFRRPLEGSDEWAHVNSTMIKPYYEIGSKFGMRLGYRLLDQYVWNDVMPSLVQRWPIED